jgi:hypothetical protein
MPVNRKAFNLLLRPGLRRDFRDGYQEYEVEWKNVVRSGTMDRAEIEMTKISGLPQQVQRNAGEAFTMVDPQMAPKITKFDTQYGLGFGVQKEMEEDDLYRKANQSAKWLGRSVRLTQEYVVADLLDDAFSGSTFTGFGGEALISATHSLIVSTSTWSNNVSGNPALGVSSLQAAFELGETTVDDQGDPIPVRIDYLIINIANEWMARQLTMNEAEPFTANRNINTTRSKRQLSYTVNHYKDQSGKDWFARDTRIHDAHLAWRIKPQMLDWYKEEVLTAFYAARQRFLVYFYDQRGWIGSNAS